MKKIKFVLFFIITAIGFIITTESFQLYISGFYDFKYSQLIPFTDLFSEEDVSNINSAAKKYNVTPFLYNDSYSENTEMIDIFTDKNGEQILSEKRELKPKTYFSFFNGKTEIKYYNLDKIANNNKITEKGIFVIGEDKDIESFNKELKNTYDCHFDKINRNTYQTYKLTCNIIWIVICAFAGMIILYDNRISKKELIIRSLYGESNIKLVVHKCCEGLITWFLVFAINILIAYFILHRTIINKAIIILFIFLVLMNTILSISLLFCNYSQVIKNKKYNKFLLSFNYIFKIISTTICVLMVSANLIIATESYTVYKQKDFFEQHKDYCYINPVVSLIGRPDEIEIQNKFYTQFINDFKVIRFSSFYDFENTTVYYANYYALDYIKKEIRELNNTDIEGKVFIAFPKTNEMPENELKHIVNDFLCDVSLEDIKIIKYDYNVNILNFDQNHINTSFYVKNPSLILDGRKNPETLKATTESINLGINNFLFRVDNKKLDQFYKDNEIANPFILTNCYDKYLETYNTYKKLLVLSGVLSIIVVFLELLIIYMVLKIEYEINSMELALKKVSGYSVFKRVKKLITITLISSVVSVCIAILIAHKYKIGSIQSVIIGGCVLIILEFLMIIFRVKHFEKTNIQKILKGGSL